MFYFHFLSSFLFFGTLVVSDFNLVMRTGGVGDFLASVLAWGVTGQQQHGSVVSAEEIDLGGADGGLRFLGGATKPFSFEPSPERTVSIHNVIDIIANPIVVVVLLFILSIFPI